MKFHVGQPVWAICDNYQRWAPGFVVALPAGMYTNCPLCQRLYAGNAYTIDIDLVGVLCRYWPFTEDHLRPRDPDQHTPATDVLELGRPREIA